MLPYELIIIVIGYLSRDATNSCSLLSHTWHRITQTHYQRWALFLYQHHPYFLYLDPEQIVRYLQRAQVTFLPDTESIQREIQRLLPTLSDEAQAKICAIVAEEHTIHGHKTIQSYSEVPLFLTQKEPGRCLVHTLDSDFPKYLKIVGDYGLTPEGEIYIISLNERSVYVPNCRVKDFHVSLVMDSWTVIYNIVYIDMNDVAWCYETWEESRRVKIVDSAKSVFCHESIIYVLTHTGLLYFFDGKTLTKELTGVSAIYPLSCAQEDKLIAVTHLNNYVYFFQDGEHHCTILPRLCDVTMDKQYRVTY